MAASAAWTSSSAEAATSGSVATPTDDRQMEVQAVAGQEPMSGNPLANTLAHRERALAARVRQHQGEFVAAEPGHDVGFARAAAG